MNKCLFEFFELTRSKVTEQDIVDYSPGDPGYPDYVRLWKHIHQSGEVPRKTEFDLSEVIGLTGWVNPNNQKDPERFRNYRRFTSAVGLLLLHFGNPSEQVRPANYLARDLIVDLEQTNAKTILLMRKLFSITRAQLILAGDENQYPFFTFGEMILAQVVKDYKVADSAASQLIEDEAIVRQSDSMRYLVQNDNFLLGLTNYDQLHQDWLKFAYELVNPNKHEDTQLVIDALERIKR